MKVSKELERAIRRAYNQSLDTIKDEIGYLYKQHGKEVPKEVLKYDRLDQLKDMVNREFKDSYKVINTLIEEHLLNAVKEAVKQTEEELKTIQSNSKMKSIPAIEFTYDVNKIINSDMSGLRWTERQDYHRDTTIKEIQEVIGKGLQRGTRVEVMAKELKERLGISYNKSIQIARTEGHRVLSQSKLENLQEINKNTPIKKKWNTVRDERVRDTHTSLDGQVVEVEQPFIFNGYEAQAPGLFGEPSLDINCRCFITMVLDT